MMRPLCWVKHVPLKSTFRSGGQRAADNPVVPTLWHLHPCVPSSYPLSMQETHVLLASNQDLKKRSAGESSILLAVSMVLLHLYRASSQVVACLRRVHVVGEGEQSSAHQPAKTKWSLRSMVQEKEFCQLSMEAESLSQASQWDHSPRLQLLSPRVEHTSLLCFNSWATDNRINNKYVVFQDAKFMVIYYTALKIQKSYYVKMENKKSNIELLATWSIY